jgi:hypothetical protein
MDKRPWWHMLRNLMNMNEKNLKEIPKFFQNKESRSNV